MKPIFAISLLMLSGMSLARVKIQEELYLPGNQPEIVKELIKAGTIEVDHVTSKGFEVYGPRGVASYLDSKKIVYLDMKQMKDKSLADYPTSAEVAKKLKAIAAKYPKIMSISSIGKSVKGKDLLVVKISDNVGADEVEPEFKYISSMHGDEITGRELTTMLIEEIGQKYGTDPEITELVNNTELFIMPSMNPDGSDLHQRANANYTDLNRNFPDITSDTESSEEGREIETKLVMKYQASRQFSLSANFHGGTIVANYPWDSKYDIFPFDDLVREFSTGYAERNPEMINSDEFSGGITNGAQWYIVLGGMQDWSYVWFNDLQITVELSHDKWPNYSEIPSFYKNNRDSMVYFMKQVHHGAGFKMSRANVSGTVKITETGTNKNLGSYAFRGSEFYKVLPEGNYSFEVKEKNKALKAISVRVEKNLVQHNGNYIQLK